jgi:D-amino-acid dehydrogenase
VYPLKGYSLTLPLRKGAHAPVASVTSLGRKTVFAPLNGKLRVAAMVEIGSSDQEVPRERIEAMVEAVEAVYPGLCDFDDPQPWTGLRPATPTSRPIVGRAHLHNLFLNVGHGALGLTLAAGAAAVVGQEIDSGATLQ